jgi:hypothetical protein
MTISVSDPNVWSEGEIIHHATPEQVQFYKDQGYLKLGRIFTKSEMDALRDHVDAMIAALPEGKRPEEMDVPHFADPWLFRYLAHPRVLDVIEDFIGPNIVLWSSHFIAKPKGNGRAVPWHTDGAYWTNRLTPMDVITLWLAVDESTLENGCMRVIPGSQKDIRASMDAYEAVDRTTNVFHARIKPELIDESKSVDLDLRIHGSNPNHSTKRRCGYTMRYMPANVVLRREGWNESHRIYLLRGEDRTGGQNEYTPVPEH